jgi:hypothetical protein
MPQEMQSTLGPYIEWSAYWKCHLVNNAQDERIAVISEESYGRYAITRLGSSQVLYRGTLRECEAFGLGLAQ